MGNMKHHLETIGGVATYPIISLLLFFFFFVALGYYVYKADKGRIAKMSNMPLEEERGGDQSPIHTN